MALPAVIVILGPTASGKSAVAAEIAACAEHQCEIVSADSMQIYQGMNIGTAKPSCEEQARIPHHLIDITSPYEDGFTVDRWLDGAHEAIASIGMRGKSAIVVGGTNLYVQALLCGLFDGPAANESLRAELRTLTLTDLRARLESVDPQSAQRIHHNDQRRMIRAIEVTLATGIAMSLHQTQWSARGPTLPDGWACVGLLPNPPSNARAINQRAKSMMEHGFLGEVTHLLARGPLASQAAEAVGYRELSQHLSGDLSLDDAIEQIKIRTRKLARHQRTWLKRFRHLERSAWSTAPCEEKSSGEFWRAVLGPAK